MSLACQQDSYLKELTATVISCLPWVLKLTVDGKEEGVECFKLILSDTILYPGGIQPDDRGFIEDEEEGHADVIKVERKGMGAIHFVNQEFTPDSVVTMKVDWDRRFDHMQQHTAQHLITACADSLLNVKTTSWSLGEKICTIELDTPSMTDQDQRLLEATVNEKIREMHSVTHRLFPDKYDPELLEYRCRGLPDDHTGAVRVVTIEGIDNTLCCGTHVSNLAHVQVIKLLKVTQSIKLLDDDEVGKMNKIHLTFVAGNRLLGYMDRAYQVERELTALLKAPLDKHVEMADKAIKGFKSCQKVNQFFMKELARLEGDLYKSRFTKDPVFFHFRKDVDSDYMIALTNRIVAFRPEVVCVVVVGDDKQAGLFIMAGPDLVVNDMGPKVAEIMEGKGALSGGRYRGKVEKVGNRHKAEKALREYVAYRADGSGGDATPEVQMDPPIQA